MVANILLLAVVVFGCFAGLPAGRRIYRATLATLGTLCWLAAAEWFARFATSTDTWLDRWPWLVAVPGWVLSAAALLLVSELLTLRHYQRRGLPVRPAVERKRSPTPTSGSVLPPPGAAVVAELRCAVPRRRC